MTDRQHEHHRAKFLTDIRTAWAFLAGFAIWFGVLAMTVAGCPIRVDPPTEDVCGSRENCGLCASESVCVWCPGSSTCVGRSSGPEACDVETVVSLPEACEVPAEAR